MAKDNVELELYLVRHGESTSNAGLDGEMSEEYKVDPPLSDLGIREAELLGEYFSDLELDCILASGLRRASRTGHEVAKRQPANGAKQVEVNKIFTECGTGLGTKGRTVEEIQKDFPTVISAEGTDPDERVVYHDKLKTDAEYLERGKKAIEYIRNRFHNGEKVMVTAHAAFNTFMLYAALELGWEQVFDPSFNNTGVTKIIFLTPGTDKFGDVHLEYHNSVAHLVKELPQFKY